MLMPADLSVKGHAVDFNCLACALSRYYIAELSKVGRTIDLSTFLCIQSSALDSARPNTKKEARDYSKSECWMSPFQTPHSPHSSGISVGVIHKLVGGGGNES